MVAGLGLIASTRAAQAQHDPALPVHIVVGPPAGAQPMARVDPSRTARTGELPSRPRELWNRGVRGGIEQVPAVDDRGNIVIATSTGELAQLGADGAEQWRTRLYIPGSKEQSASTIAPVLLSDGTRMVLTALGDAWGLTSAGGRNFTENLVGVGRDSRVAALPRDDGSAVMAVWGRLLVVGPDGKVRDQAEVGEALVGALIGTRDGIVATSDSGAVWQWAPPLQPRKLGTFQGSVREGVALADENTLVAVVDRRRLVAMDRRSGGADDARDYQRARGAPGRGSRRDSVRRFDERAADRDRTVFRKASRCAQPPAGCGRRRRRDFVPSEPSGDRGPRGACGVRPGRRQGRSRGTGRRDFPGTGDGMLRPYRDRASWGEAVPGGVSGRHDSYVRGVGIRSRLLRPSLSNAPAPLSNNRAVCPILAQ